MFTVVYPAFMTTPAPLMYSLEQVAEGLGLNVRTVRHYVRSGRLKAVRIGKQYRVTREALESITGPATAALPSAALARQRHVEVSSVIQIDAVNPDTASRVVNHLLAAAKAPRDDDTPLRAETIYDEERARMKIIVVGSLPVVGDMFKLISAILKS
jgi:excisionase family DNA binding protein